MKGCPEGWNEAFKCLALWSEPGTHRIHSSLQVEEFRMLQVYIFDTLQNNLATIDFSVLLIGVMTVADEIDPN
jgi:hypothetical protein